MTLLDIPAITPSYTGRQIAKITTVMPIRHFMILERIVSEHQTGGQVTQQSLVDEFSGCEYWSFFITPDGRKNSPGDMGLIGDLERLHARGYAFLELDGRVHPTKRAELLYNSVHNN